MEIKTAKTKKTQTYELRNIESCSYAFISLTNLHEGAGILHIVSDFGNWSYLWGSMGSDIREFLISTNTEYLMDKLTMDNRADRDVFNFEKSIQRMKRDIIQYRKDDCISAKLARQAYNEAKEFGEHGYFNNQYEYYTEAMEYEGIGEVFCDDHFPCHKEYSSSLRSFMKTVWPEFIKIIEAEMSVNDKFKRSKEELEEYNQLIKKIGPITEMEELKILKSFKAGIKFGESEINYLKNQLEGFQSQYNTDDKIINGYREKLKTLKSEIRLMAYEDIEREIDKILEERR